MRQSTSIRNRANTAALYVRLSRDDNLDGDSNSIQSQKKLLTKTAKERGYTNLLTFCDDGISGVTMNRPGYIEMMTELKKGYISAVFVKDLSRLGRNYIEVGKLTEDFLPENDIRLVSVTDNIDSDEGENDLNPIRNLFNEWYSRDISKKQRIRYKVKGSSGEPLSLPPYGYTKNPDDPTRWVIDPEAAEIVRRIFNMSIDGKGAEQIAAALHSERILNPTQYWNSKGIGRGGKKSSKDPCHWNCSAVTAILSRQEYCGDVVNFKTYSKSYKNKKRIDNAPENWVIFKDKHDPIIDRATFERVQERRLAKTRKRKTNSGEKNIFSGLLVCADCGHNLHFHFNQKNHDILYFNCSNYKGNRGTCQTTHYIRVDFLEEVIRQEIRRLTKYASQHEAEFAEVVMGHAQQSGEFKRDQKQKELSAMIHRDKELDTLFNRMYEDNINGRIDDSRFAKMSHQYTEEQKELAERINALTAELDKQTTRAMTTDMFIAAVRKYTRAKKLTERMLNELIEQIEVHQAEKTEGLHIQRLTIHYSCVGAIQIPDMLTLPEIIMQTRKGVKVKYSTEQTVI
ncbi:MAG: recombinase family protein [Oscillospiraceae bacterium]|nr:recombinase family protein [Oscillospiraceae bacterium]